LAPRNQKIIWYDEKKAKKRIEAVVKIASAAVNSGMTYGKYVSAMEMKKSAAGGNQLSGQRTNY